LDNNKLRPQQAAFFSAKYWVFFNRIQFTLSFMKTKFLLCIALTVLHFSIFGQSYSFKVLVNKGKNEVKSGNNWQTMKVGASLGENDEIKIGANAYLGLVHVSGKPIELKEAKTYKVADLTKKVSSGSSVVTKYTDFILSSAEQKKSNLAATGAVHRGLGDFAVFLPTTPEHSVFFAGTQVLSWDNSEFKGPYVVTFTSLFGDELKVIKTNDNFAVVDLESREFQNEDNVMVMVFSEGEKKKSADFTLKRVSKADKARIKSLLATEVGDAASEENALAKSLLAAFYENNRLLIDAATAYRQAIQLAPDVPIYQEYYAEYLLRAGLKPEPKKD
jgi:hypothetical protein